MNILNKDGSVDVERFRVMTAKYLSKNTGSKEDAIDALVRSGIYDKDTRKLSTYYTGKSKDNV